MIATAGDEAFVMLALIPGTFLKLTLLIFVIALIVGFILTFFPKIAEYQPFSLNRGFHVHENEVECVCFEPETIPSRLKNISFTRALFLAGTLILLILILLGEIGPKEWNWVRYVLLGSTSVTLFIISTVPEHFLNEHVWEHIIKKHFIKIFLWTFGTLLVLGFLVQHFEIEQWIRGNMYLILMIALLVGIIPESGPHMVFISLFIAGTIPLSILLANSIVQDGHGSLPLLAESKKSFLYVKLINLFVGLMVGLSGVYFNL
jgi:cytochrome c oxidase subunit IV